MQSQENWREFVEGIHLYVNVLLLCKYSKDILNDDELFR